MKLYHNVLINSIKQQIFSNINKQNTHFLNISRVTNKKEKLIFDKPASKASVATLTNFGIIPNPYFETEREMMFDG